MDRTAHRPRSRSAARAGAALVSLITISGCTGGAGGVEQATAEQVMQVTSVHPETGMTLLEGPTFGPDGKLRVVDVTAPAGKPKVLTIDVDARQVISTYTENSDPDTDRDGAYTSAQFSPHDGRLYLTDYSGGRIVSTTPDGRDPVEFTTGEIAGQRMHPDDLAFDDDGHLYVSDSSPTTYPEGRQEGRVLRFDRDTGKADVLASGLPNPNGISFSAEGDALWISLLDANRIDELALDEQRTSVEQGHAAIHVNAGTAQTDSNAVDADGNIYQGVHGTPQIRVYSPTGTHLKTITLPAGEDGLESATNLAIRPGTTDAYVTASGKAGGYLYEFNALAEGTRQSNGG